MKTFKASFPITDRTTAIFKGTVLLQGVPLLALGVVWLVQHAWSSAARLDTWANEISSCVAIGLAFATSIYLAGEFPLKTQIIFSAIFLIAGTTCFGVFWFAVPGCVLLLDAIKWLTRAAGRNSST